MYEAENDRTLKLKLVLTGSRDLATRRPYPNKNYLVGCRKLGQKAIDGIFIETQQHLWAFTTIARWAVNADAVVSHRTNYIVLDEDFDAVSDNMTLWYATDEGLGSWGTRWPECAKSLIPASSEPRMDIWPVNMGGAKSEGDVNDILARNGLIIERNETFKIPTIERDRLFGKHAKNERFPSMEAAFQSLD